MTRRLTRNSARLASAKTAAPATQSKLYSTLKASKASTRAGITKRKPKTAAAAAAASPPSSSPPLARAASPTATNAPLVPPVPTTGGSTTTDTILAQALAHLVSQAPTLQSLVAAHTCLPFLPAGLATPVNPFESLVSGILSQQVSGAAAKSIKARFVALFPASAGFPTPKQVLAIDQTTLRTAGLSGRKAEYVHSLSEAFVSGNVGPTLFATGCDEEIMTALTAIRGIGRWSAEMFLMFGLKRLDVFSTGDLGIQRGMAAFCLGKDVKAVKGKGKWKYMAEKEMEEHAERFRPYRSVFCWYMWRVGDVTVDAMGGDGPAAETVPKPKKEVEQVVDVSDEPALRT